MPKPQPVPNARAQKITGSIDPMVSDPPWGNLDTVKTESSVPRRDRHAAGGGRQDGSPVFAVVRCQMVCSWMKSSFIGCMGRLSR
jgi:hypothetical protein